MTIQLKHPDRLQLRSTDGAICYGYNQDWYAREWQRKSGCGPTAATLLSGYVLQRDGYLPADARSVLAQRRAAMEDVWPYVTPSHCCGLYKTRWFADGLQRYLDTLAPGAYGLQALPIYPFSLCRRPDKEIFQFIRRGIAADSPVAFLNRGRGSEQELSTWHWISIVTVDPTPPYGITCYDNGSVTHFSLSQWLGSTVLGGGFCFISTGSVAGIHSFQEDDV